MDNEVLDRVLLKLTELPSMDLAELLEEKVKETPSNGTYSSLVLRLENKTATRLQQLYTEKELKDLLLQISFLAMPKVASRNGLVYGDINHPCIICSLKKEPEQFEPTIEICRSCLDAINKPQIVNYIFRLLDYMDSDIAMSIYKKFKSKNRYEICTQFSEENLRGMILDLASDLDSDIPELEQQKPKSQPILNPELPLRLVACQVVLAKYPVMDITREVRKFQQGAMKKKSEEWREYVPNFLKTRYSVWRTASITDVYNVANKLISTGGKPARDALLSFSAELSRIIFDNPNVTQVAGEPIYEPEEVKEHITSVVAKIMLPHLDVMDKIEETTSGVYFDALPFEDDRDSLIRKVKNRDHNLCLVCKTTDDIHVHHRIPEKYGNINNWENLVLLCGSCQTAVENTNLQTAVEVGISNYTKSLGRRLLEQENTR